LQKEAAAAGIVILCECGVDPGIDHMSALELMDRFEDSRGSHHVFLVRCATGLPVTGVECLERMAKCPASVFLQCVEVYQHLRRQTTLLGTKFPWSPRRGFNCHAEFSMLLA